MTDTLTDATALVTGASSGIGAATARELASRGANVVLSARREERLETLAAEITDDHGAEAVAHPTDVTDAVAVEALVDATVERFGGLDVVVSNAGLGRTETAIEDLDLDAYRQMMDVNCDGMFHVARAAMPHLTECSGNLLFLGSMAGQYPRPGAPVYAATKWWTRGFALSLQGSVGDAGVGVTVINPTEVRTEFGSEDGEQFADAIDPGEAAEPADVARAIAFAAAREDPNVVQELDLFRRDKFIDW
ncbi:NADP-dependent 3-hydroxy acid dehydrogenase YdfG [Halarchaeum rubridurum]|uniref:NADP-dependent 3-hydroxy acid dehydrogenase YdfG n=1 Tax=Halarchaeum rubridurum TaxID=489911 RepID=A0A830FU26_9EURY|nr:SDR family oxidoreductase [Halarchaeum rubridurum]MBP1954408.1 NADP-dependent 3-hydroxy acid dehydrogenase YdfG [Halarchaeum rubridurum]GGM60766.1 short-chain dehydrogenase [Halarchaeum rubridurum]